MNVQEKIGTLPGIEEMQENAHRASDFLKSLSHENRLLILCQLVEGEKSVGELAELLDVRQPTLSQHLARLRAEGLVETRRDGTTIHYRLGDQKVRPVIEVLYGLFCA